MTPSGIEPGTFRQHLNQLHHGVTPLFAYFKKSILKRNRKTKETTGKLDRRMEVEVHKPCAHACNSPAIFQAVCFLNIHLLLF